MNNPFPDMVSNTLPLATDTTERLGGWRAEAIDGHNYQAYEEEEDLSRWQPRENLPDECVPTKQNPRPPLMQFGLPVAVKSLEAYAEKLEAAGFFPPLNTNRRRNPAFLACHISIYFRKQYGLRTGYAHSNMLPEGTDVLIQLCSNYSVQERGGLQQAEGAAELVKQELGLDPGLQAQWFCDRHWDSPRIYDDLAVWKRSFAFCR